MRCRCSSNARITARAISTCPGLYSYSGCALAINPSTPKTSSMFMPLLLSRSANAEYTPFSCKRSASSELYVSNIASYNPRSRTSLLMRTHKLLERLKNNPTNVTFDDIRTLLLREGFTLDRVTGSHHIFKKSGTIFVIPVHSNRVKSVYVKRVIEIVEQAKGTI